MTLKKVLDCKFIPVAILIAFLLLSRLGIFIFLILLVLFVTIPLAFLMAIFPIFTLAATSYCLGMRLGAKFSSRFTRHAVAFVFTAAVMMIPPWLANTKLEKNANALMAEDRISASLSAPAILSFTYVNPIKITNKCDNICIRLLLNGQVKGVVMAYGPPWSWPSGNDVEANLYYLEKADNCDESVLEDVEGDRGIFESERLRVNTRELLYLKMLREGLCLRKRPARAEEVEAVLHEEFVQRGITDLDAGFNIFADTISATRLSWFSRKNGEWIEQYRVTGIHMYKLLPILMPTYISGFGFDTESGFLRREIKINTEKISHIRFLRDALKLDLEVDDGYYLNQVLGILEGVDKGKIKPTAQIREIWKGFVNEALDNFDIGRDGQKLLLNVLRRQDMPIPEDIDSIFGKIKKSPDLVRIYADILVERLERIPRDAYPHKIKEIEYIMEGIVLLPKELRMKYRKRLLPIYLHLLKDHCARIKLGGSRSFLISDFAEEAMPILKSLAATPHQYKEGECTSYGIGEGEKEEEMDADNRVFLFMSFCKLGEKASQILPIVQRMKAWGYPMVRLKVATLLNLGMDEKEVRMLVPEEHRDNTRWTRECYY